MLNKIHFFRYQVFLDKEFILELNLLPASVNTLVLQRNSGKIVSILKCLYFYSQ